MRLKYSTGCIQHDVFNIALDSSVVHRLEFGVNIIAVSRRERVCWRGWPRPCWRRTPWLRAPRSVWQVRVAIVAFCFSVVVDIINRNCFDVVKSIHSPHSCCLCFLCADNLSAGSRGSSLPLWSPHPCRNYSK